MTKNLKTFRNDMPDDWNYETLLSSQNSNIVRNVIETTSDIAQVKLIPYLIDQIPGVSPEDAYHTAIILADENLIVPMLTSLPGNIGDINITMGYPLKMTGVYSLIKHLLNLQRNSSLENDKTYFGYKDVLEILKHQLIEIIINEDGRLIIDEIINKNLFRISSDFLCRSEVLKIIFRRTADPRELSDYLREILSIISADNKNDDEAFQDQIMQKNLRNEFIYSVLLSVNRLETIIKSPDVRFKTCGSLIKY
jgi:hypothetical protein